MMRQTWSLITTPLFPLCFASTLLVFDPLIRIATLFGKEATWRAYTLLNKALVFSIKLTGARFDIDSTNFPKDTDEPLIFACNHQTMLDMPILFTILSAHRPIFISKQELGKFYPSISVGLRSLGACLINRKNAKQSLSLIREHGKKQVSTIVFPEGTRAPRGELGKFHRSGLDTLEKASGMKVVGVLMMGQADILNTPKKIIKRNVEIKICFSEALEADKGSLKSGVTEAYEKWARKTLPTLST